jgi:hypothetical protein
VRFPRLVDFVLPTLGNRISCYARQKTPRNTVRHFFLDYVLPAYLSRDRLVLHASAIRIAEKRAIAFLGRTGSGKSTLAACFWKQGFQIMADDCTVVELGNGTPACVPSYPGLRLWDDSARELLSPERKRSLVAHYSNKSRFKHPRMEDKFDGRAIPLERIYYLEPRIRGDDRIRIRPISGSKAFIKILQSSFRLDFKRREPLLEEFNRLKRIADCKLLYSINFPRDFRRADELTRAILDDIRQKEVSVAQS